MSQRHQFSEASLPLFESDEVVISQAIPEGKLPSYIADHRQRLRARFLSGGADAMPDYELLELVLFRAIPRRDVKPLTRDLLNKFNDFNGVITAAPERLLEVKGVGEAVICELKIVAATAQRLARSRVLQRPVVSSWEALIDYCHTAMAHRDTSSSGYRFSTVKTLSSLTKNRPLERLIMSLCILARLSNAPWK